MTDCKIMSQKDKNDQGKYGCDAKEERNEHSR